MPKTKSIPPSDSGFDNYQNNLIGLCTTNQVAWGISLTELGKLTTPQGNWESAYTPCKNKKTATTVQRNAKTLAKKALIAKLRPFIQSQIQYNSTMTDGQKLSCGVKPRSGQHSAVPAPSSRPVMDAQPAVGSTVKVTYRQEVGSDGSSKRGKPDGVAKCKMVYIVGTTAPASPDVCTTTKNASKNPTVFSFSPTQSGQKLYGFACWVNDKDEAGPWSEMFKCTIP